MLPISIPGPRGRHSARRSHAKTRTGCRTCKKRKIKCDETQPSCDNCAHYGVVCDFVQEQHKDSESMPEHRLPGPDPDPALPSASISTRRVTNDSLAPSTILNVLDLELMYHWTTSTSSTLTHDPQLSSFWRQNFVTFGHSCSFVMRGILSLSALHLARSCPEREAELVAKSVACQQLAHKGALAAMESFRQDRTLQLTDDIFCYSLVTMFIVLSNSRTPEDTLFASGSPDWIRVYAGVHEFGLLSGPGRRPDRTISPIGLFAVNRYKLGERAKKVNHSHLDHIVTELNAADIDPKTRRIYDRAVGELHATFGIFYCGMHGESPDIMDLFLWLTKVMRDFIPLLQSKTQEALAIFSYFSMLLVCLPRRWWLFPWAENLKVRTYELLDAEHRKWVVEPSVVGNGN